MQMWEQTWVRRFWLRFLPAPGLACSEKALRLNGRRAGLRLIAGGRASAIGVCRACEICVSGCRKMVPDGRLSQRA